MTEQNSPARHPFEPREADLAAANRPPPSELERFLGGSPSSVAVRLVFLSLIVGFFLVVFDIRPFDVLVGLRNIVEHFWAMGFDAIREHRRISRRGRGHRDPGLAGAAPAEHARQGLKQGLKRRKPARARPVCDAPAGPGRRLLFRSYRTATGGP